MKNYIIRHLFITFLFIVAFILSVVLNSPLFMAITGICGFVFLLVSGYKILEEILTK